MKRINVIGTSGCGKSAFAKKLALKISSRHYEIDALFWKPGWQESSHKELNSGIEKITSQHSWVLDGNYHFTIPVKWKNADTIIWLDYSFLRVILQSFKRALQRSLTQKEIWPGTGNKESFGKNFFSRDSVLLWTMKSYKSNRLFYKKIIASNKYDHLNFIIFKNPRQADSFLKNLK